MMKNIFITITALIATFTAANPVTYCPALSCTSTHQVAQGESFSSIGQSLGINFHLIENCNPNVVPESLQIGQVIYIPDLPFSNSCPDSVIVNQGDTFSSIATMYNLNLNDVVNCNCFQDPTTLQVGQKVLVPAKSNPPVPTCPALSCTSTHQVAQGESFSSIGQSLGINFHLIENCNPNVVPESLQIGQVIYIPDLPFSKSCPASVIVNQGDTFSSIATMYNLNLNDVINCNCFQDPTTLQVGQKVLVPAQSNPPVYYYSNTK